MKTLTPPPVQLETLISNIPGLVYQCCFDKEWTMMYLSEGTLELTGHPAEDFISNKELSYSDLIHPEDRIYVWNQINKQLKGNGYYELAYRIIHANNKIKWVWEKGRLVESIHTKDLHLEGVITDITSIKEVEKKLAATEEEYSNVFNAVTEGLIYANRKGKVIALNPGFTFLTGISQGAVLGKTALHLARKMIPVKDIPRVLKYIQAVLSGTPGQLFEIEYNNKLLECSSHSDPAADGLVVLVRDITEARRLQVELADSKRKAEESDRLKSAFLANMSHEIRTPLNSVLGFSELLDDAGTTPQERSKYVHQIQVNGELLLKIINDILDISRIESGQVFLVNKEFHLNSFIDEMAESARLDAHRKKIEIFVIKDTTDEKATIFADQSRLRQVLGNLVNNAIKFTNSGHVRFGYLRHGDKTEFFVEDTGVGIPVARQKDIFKRFHQTGDQVIPNYRGTGLGLAISKSLVELMGGEIGFISNPGKGSRFYFILELATF